MIKLIEFNAEDYKLLQKWINSEKELVAFSGRIFTLPIDRLQVENYLASPNRKVFKVVDVEENAIGMAEISEENKETGKLARILIADEELRGKGLGTELVEKLTNYAFTTLDKSAVILNVYSWNTGAIRCYEKAGFKITSKKPTTIEVGDEIWTSLEMKIGGADH